jgi:hypothetical protein
MHLRRPFRLEQMHRKLVGYVLERRDHVVGQVRIHQPAVGVVEHLFEQRLTQAEQHAPLDL